MPFIYKNLKAQLQKHQVTDEEVERNLHRLADQNPRVAQITDRPTQEGDEVILDYAGFCDGEQFAGGTAENQTLVLGSGMFIPGFEAQLLDKIPGEQVTVEVTFPESYHAENLAGKPAQFHCTVKAIQVKTPYELDDTFAQEVGHCETLAEMKETLRQSLQAYADDRGEMDLQDRLLQQAAQTLDLTITSKMLESALDEQMDSLKAQLAQQGLSLEMYCQFLNTTPEQLRQDATSSAEASIRARAAIDEIVTLEGLTADKEDIAKALAIICRHNGITMDQLKEQYDAGLEQVVINSVLTGKVMRLIRDAADITEV